MRAVRRLPRKAQDDDGILREREAQHEVVGDALVRHHELPQRRVAEPLLQQHLAR